MASQLSGLIHDQNLNVHYNGASAGTKAPMKGALSGRKPLGDLSNSMKPTPNQSLKKQNSNIFSEKVIGDSKPKITIDGSKKKSFSKALEKLPTSGRKALSDISNSGMHLHEAPKKNLNAKLSVLAEEDLNAIAEEGFLHNHQECIKAQTKAMDIDELLWTVGLDKGFLKQSAPPPQSSKLMLASPPRYSELKELPDEKLEDLSPWKYDQFCYLEFPSPCGSPKLPNHYMQWKDHEDADFTLMESP